MESSGKPLRQVLPNQREVQTTRSPVDSGVKCSPRAALVLKRVAVARQRDPHRKRDHTGPRSAAGDRTSWPGIVREFETAQGAVWIDSTRRGGVVQHRAVFARVVEEADYPGTIGRLDHLESHAETGSVFLKGRDFCCGQSKTLWATAAHGPALVHANATGLFVGKPANEMHRPPSCSVGALRDAAATPRCRGDGAAIAEHARVHPRLLGPYHRLYARYRTAIGHREPRPQSLLLSGNPAAFRRFLGAVAKPTGRRGGGS